MITVCYVKIFAIAKSISKRDDVSMIQPILHYHLPTLCNCQIIPISKLKLINQSLQMVAGFSLSLINTNFRINLRITGLKELYDRAVIGVIGEPKNLHCIFFPFFIKFNLPSFQALVRSLESSSQRRSFTNSTNTVDLKRNTISDCNRTRADLELPKSPSSSAQRKTKSVRRGLPHQTSMSRGPGDLSRPASDSALIRKRQNKSNTVTVLVIIGKSK